MSRRALSTRSPAIVVWGWYAIAILAPSTVGGAMAGLVRHEAPTRAFWAAWWAEDPRRCPDADPDAFGFVDGSGLVHGEAIGAAYNALRAARGPRVYGMSVGEAFAHRAFREGAPRQRSAVVDFEALAIEGFARLGLDPSASPAEVTRAFKAAHPDHGGGEAVDMNRLTELYRAARAFAKRRAIEQELAAARAGTVSGRKPKRGRRAEVDGKLLECSASLPPVFHRGCDVVAAAIAAQGGGLNLGTNTRRRAARHAKGGAS